MYMYVKLKLNTSCQVLYRYRQLRKSLPVTATFFVTLNFYLIGQKSWGPKAPPAPPPAQSL